MTDRPRLNPFVVVEMFEREVARYTGAPYAVAVDSCTNALFLSLLWFGHFYPRTTPPVVLPRRTYVGVAQAVRNARFEVVYSDEDWQGTYPLRPFALWDSAKSFHRGMYQAVTLTCVSFQASKILPIGRGGAILTDNQEAAEWLRKARFDGRTAGDSCDTLTEVQRPGFHMYMTPPDAARGLWLLYYLEDDPSDQQDEYPDLSVMPWD